MKLLITILLSAFLSSIALANSEIDEIESKINDALELKDMKHKNWDEVAELLTPLLKAKDPDAIYYSTFLYSFGTGGYPENIEKAKSLMKEAAEMGSVPAMLSLARHNEYGLSGAINIPNSVYWYKKSGNSGSRSAASRLEEAYRKGELGLSKDNKLATKWEKIKGKCKKP